MMRGDRRATLQDELEATEELHQACVKLLKQVFRDINRISWQLATIAEVVDRSLDEIG